MKARHAFVALFSRSAASRNQAGAFTNHSSSSRGQGTSAPLTSARRRFFTAACLSLLGLVALLGTSAAGSAVAAEPCPNATLRAENRSTKLPDCRAYEMVTPPYKQGYPVSIDAIAADGSRAVAHSLGVFAGAVGGPGLRNSPYTEYELSRGSTGWQPTALAPSNPQFRDASEWRTPSADLSSNLFSMPTAPVGEDDFYVRTPSGVFVRVGPATPPADGPTGPPGTGPQPFNFPLDGASSNLSHVLFEVSAYQWPGDETLASSASLYEYIGTSNSQPFLVGVTGGLGSTSLIGQCGVIAGGPGSSFNAISDDGATVFFTPIGADVGECGKPQPPVSGLFARLHEAETVQLSTPSPVDCTVPACTAAPAADALFEGASRDGSKAFFTSTQQLTDSSSEDAESGDSAIRNPGTGCPEAHASGCNLYLYDFNKPTGENLVTVSAGSASPHVQGVTRISQDGSHVYFVAQGVLTEGANAEGNEPTAGADNLYLFQRGTEVPQGRTSFVATLAPSDEEVWESGDRRPAHATPDGRFLVFQSHADLTPDDTSVGVWQVFEYNSETERLARVSIGQNGFNHNGNTETNSATIPRPDYGRGSGGQRPQMPALSDDGSYVVFQSALGLTPSALNSVTIDPQGNEANNVYQYHDGQVALISTGQDVSVSGDRSGSNVTLIGTSGTGADVFFNTGEPILSQDVDSQVDTYDARIDGGFPNPPLVPGCSEDACQGPLQVPPFGQGAASSQFQGAGNRRNKHHKARHHQRRHHAKTHHQKRDGHEPNRRSR